MAWRERKCGGCAARRVAFCSAREEISRAPPFRASAGARRARPRAGKWRFFARAREMAHPLEMLLVHYAR